MEAVLRSQSVAHLKKMVSTWTNSHRIKGYSRMKKDDLVMAMMGEMRKKKGEGEMLQDVVKRMAKPSEKQLKAQSLVEAKKEAEKRALEVEKRIKEADRQKMEARKKKAQEALTKFSKEQKEKEEERKKRSIALTGKVIEFKPDALRKQLKMRKADKLTKPIIRKMLSVPDGGVIEPFNKKFNMTPKLRKRLIFALNMMSSDKK